MNKPTEHATSEDTAGISHTLTVAAERVAALGISAKEAAHALKQFAIPEWFEDWHHELRKRKDK